MYIYKYIYYTHCINHRRTQILDASVVDQKSRHDWGALVYQRRFEADFGIPNAKEQASLADPVGYLTVWLVGVTSTCII